MVLVMMLLSLTIGLLGLVSNYALAVLGICMFVAYRPLFYTVVSDFCAKVFGFQTFELCTEQSCVCRVFLTLANHSWTN